MPRPGPRTTYKYSDRFKATAVRLSQLRDVSVQEVGDSLTSIPSCCLVGARSARGQDRDERALEDRARAFKKAIEFTSKRKQTSSPSASIAKRSTRSD
jgi:transposase